MKCLVVIMILTAISNVVHGQAGRDLAAAKRAIDSMVNTADKNLHVVVGCGPTISKRSAYSSYTSDSLVYTSGFLYKPETKLQYNWKFDYVATHLVKVTVSLNYIHQPEFYQAVYYFQGKEVLWTEGEDLKYSDKENILKSVEVGMWQPLNLN